MKTILQSFGEKARNCRFYFILVVSAQTTEGATTMTLIGILLEILFWLIVTAIGGIFVYCALYIKKKMEDAGSSNSPDRESAQKFLDELTEAFGSDFFELYRTTIHLFTCGLLLAIVGILMLSRMIFFLSR